VSNTALKVLELHSNAVGPMGATALANALRGNTAVRALNFNDNELLDEGAEAVALLLKGPRGTGGAWGEGRETDAPLQITR
jgi:Ran GTPase-activating protein (RanGAP) involved in mRNA processing and transport